MAVRLPSFALRHRGDIVLRKLILVKHAVPQIIPTFPSHVWHLSADGQQPCLPLARLLASYGPATIVSSREPKAAETAAYVAAHLHTSWRLGEGLHEHDRGNVGYLSKEHFDNAVATFFSHPFEIAIIRGAHAARVWSRGGRCGHCLGHAKACT